MSKRSLADLIAHADALADEFEACDPTQADFDAHLPPVATLRVAAYRRAAADRELAEAVAAGGAAHLSWRQVGEAIGTTGEAARQRYAAS